MSKMQRKLTLELGYEPSVTELADALEMSEDKVMEIMRHMAILLREMNAGYARIRSSAEAKKLNELPPPTGMRAVLLKEAAVWQNAVH